MRGKRKNYFSGKFSRFLSMITLIAMMIIVFGALPAVADYPGDSWGTAIHIKTASDLAGISNATKDGLYYVLDNDIDLSSYTNWTPISDVGPGGNAFFGHFDGNGHTISNLTINDTSTGDTGTGLFGSLQHGYTEVKNITLTNVNIKSTNKNCEIGTVSCFLEGTVTNCHVSGTLSCPGSVGGLIGSSDEGTHITNCSFSGSVSGLDEVGGLVAHHNGLMSGCFTHGSVTGSGPCNGIGGLAGSSNGSRTDGIVDCYSDASVSGSDGAPWVGGLVGSDYPGPISNSYFAGSVTTSGNNEGWGTGGIAGRLTDGGGTITNCYVAGPVTNSGGNFVGALVGRNGGIITGSYWDQDVTGQTNAVGYERGTTDATGEATTAMIQQSTFSGWDFGSTWKINNGSSYPFLVGVSLTPSASGQTTNPNPTSGTAATIVLQVGSSTMTVNGKTTQLDAAPEIKYSRVFLPIRAIIEAMGGTVAWDAASQQVTIESGANVIDLWIGRKTAQVNGQTKPIGVAPYVSDSGRTMLPLRFVTENLGCQVDWDGSTQGITITYTPGTSK